MKAETFLPEDYRPAEDEPFMNERQAEYFRRKLLAWKEDILEDSRDTVEGLQENTRNIPDVADRALEVGARALAHPYLVGTGEPDLPFRRRSCCLFYRIPGGGTCGDCVLA